MSARHILLTGATGGLGLACTRELISRGHRVRAVGRSHAAGRKLEALGAEFVPFDLEKERDPSVLVDDCESVIHAAALSASWGPLHAFQSANVDAARRLLDAAKTSGVRRFVFISSPSIFARFRDQTGIGEQAEPADPPLNFYAQTKLLAERLVLASPTDAMACCAIRPRALVGEGDRVILPKLAEMAMRSTIPMPRGGKALIELTDLRDAAFAICQAEERALALTGRAINISGGNPMPVREVADQLAQTLGHSPRFTTPPLALLRMAAAFLEAFAKLTGQSSEPALTRYTLATLAYSQSFDPEPAERLLGFRPRFCGLTTLLELAKEIVSQEKSA